MSKEGIDITAKVFSVMQAARHKLLTLGAGHPSTKSGQADLLMAHMLENGKDAMKVQFEKVTADPASQ